MSLNFAKRTMLAKLFGKKKTKEEQKSYDYLQDCTFAFGNEHTTVSEQDYGQMADKSYVRNVIANRAISIVAVAASSVPINLSKRLSNTNRCWWTR